MQSLSELLAPESIVLVAVADSVDDAIEQAGAALVATGAVDEPYVAAMLDRERSVSTYVGEGVAIPHATRAGTASVLRDALVLLRFADPIDWNGHDVSVVIGIAAEGSGYIGLLSQLATILLEPGRAEALRAATSTDEVYAVLSPPSEQ